jgi:hypothetical protein
VSDDPASPFDPDEGWVLFHSASPPQLLQGLPNVWGPTTSALVFRDRFMTGLRLGVEAARCWPEPAWHFFPDQFRPPGLTDDEWNQKRHGPRLREAPETRFVRRETERSRRSPN